VTQTAIEPPPSRDRPDNDVTLHRAPDLHSLLLGGVFLLLLFFALYLASAIVLPIVLGFVLSMVLQPPMRWLLRYRVPRAIGALLITVLCCGAAVGVAATVSAPAVQWVAKVPEGFWRLEAHLYVVKRSLQSIQRITKDVEKLAEPTASPAEPKAVVASPSLGSLLFSGTRATVTELLTTVLMLYFLLASGDLFLRRLVEILPTFADKKQAVEIAHEIERNISSYLVTISLMNAAVGLATGLGAWACGLPDPVLWGTVAFLLNYVPILGPLAGVAILFLVGLLSFDTLGRAVLPAAIYLTVHLIEGENVTPMLLARRFTLNPVLVIISLIFWYWMWGVAGALLAIPMLATVKIVCDRVEPLMPLGHFLSGDGRD
jgi:predicted PurR-regulated permease PerM